MATNLRRLESALVRFESVILVTLLSVMVVMSFSQVIMRQFFGTGLLWGDTFLRHLVLWVGFLGAALATADGKQFAWDMGTNMLKPRAKLIVQVLAHLATAGITGFLVRASWLFLIGEKDVKSVLFSIGEHQIPTWTFSIILPAGFGLVLIHTLIKAGLLISAGVPPAGKEGGEKK